MTDFFKEYGTYYRQLARLGLPIVAGQAGMILVSFADNVMVGHYSTEALASASFVNNVFNIAILTCIGFSYGITPWPVPCSDVKKKRPSDVLCATDCSLTSYSHL